METKGFLANGQQGDDKISLDTPLEGIELDLELVSVDNERIAEKLNRENPNQIELGKTEKKQVFCKECEEQLASEICEDCGSLLCADCVVGFAGKRLCFHCTDLEMIRQQVRKNGECAI